VDKRGQIFNGGQWVDDHFGGITDMIGIGKGGQRPVKTVMMSRYACYLVIQNADPAKEIVALGQTYFAVQTRRQERTDQQIEAQRRLLLRAEVKARNVQTGRRCQGCTRRGTQGLRHLPESGYAGLYGGLTAANHLCMNDLPLVALIVNRIDISLNSCQSWPCAGAYSGSQQPVA
jgi:DNA-damage-inducible protein D